MSKVEFSPEQQARVQGLIDEAYKKALNKAAQNFGGRFKVGDRVQVIAEGNLKGKVGTIVGLESDGCVVAVDFDEKVAQGHSCDGKAKEGHGRYFRSTELILLEQKNDLSSARVGDRLWCNRFGECVVIRVSEGTDYPIIVNFTGNDGFWFFNFEGKNLKSDLLPTLFWSKPTILYPPPPKRVVKKKGWAGFQKSVEGVICPRCSALSDSKAEANYYADQDPSIPRAVFIEHEYEEVSDE